MAEWRELPDADRDLLLANDELVCHQCGNLRSECSNPDIDWHGHESVCWATATSEWWQRRLREQHKNAEPSADALHPLDGVTVYSSRIEPEGDQFTSS